MKQFLLIARGVVREPAFWFGVLLLLLFAWWTLAADAADVLTSRNDLARSGVNAAETTLTPERVTAGTFGKLWTLYADGQVVAQPLYASDVTIETPTLRGTYDVVVIATMHNTLYVYDANNERPGPNDQNVPLWSTWFGKPRRGDGGIDMFYTNDPEWGILSTPVIDPAKKMLYAVSWHEDSTYRLHAIRLKDGVHLKLDTIAAPGLNARHQKQRPGLALHNGILYVAFGGDGSRGLLVAYDAATLDRRASWTVTPTGNNGGLWQSGQAPSIDRDGNLYVMTGNGTFGGQNYGQSVVKLRLDGSTLRVLDHFTPCNASFQNAKDLDLGTTGPVLLPGKMLLGGSKIGSLYLLSTDNMGKYIQPVPSTAENCDNPNILQEVKQGALSHIHGSPIYWEGPDGPRVFVWGEFDRLRAYRFETLRITPAPTLGTYRPPDGMPGGMLGISSQGHMNGILWAVVPLTGDANKYRGVKGIVIAHDARDVTTTLWTSEQAGARDRLGLFAKFTPPTIADGKVFVATYGDDEPLRRYGGQVRPQTFPRRYEVAVYGRLAGVPAPVINRNRADVQLLTAAVETAPRLDPKRCRPLTGDVLDCTDELGRVSQVPSLERVLVPQGFNFVGCQLLRVTTAARQGALPGMLGIGFYSADVTPAQYAATQGRFISAEALTRVGTGTLADGHPAVFHQFSGLVGCEMAPNIRADKHFKPYMDFVGGPPRTVYRNWDIIQGNYAISAPTGAIDRRTLVLR